MPGLVGSARLTGPSQMNATSCATEGTDFHPKFSGQSSPGTKDLTAGQFDLTVWATITGNDRYTVYQAQLTVDPDLSTGTPAQVHARKMLTLLETAIYNRVNGNSDGGIENYAIGGISIAKATLEQLERMRAKYAREVARLQNPDKQIGSVKFAMTPAGNPVNLKRRYS